MRTHDVQFVRLGFDIHTMLPMVFVTVQMRPATADASITDLAPRVGNLSCTAAAPGGQR
jgi:hypothetical protein